MSKRVLYLLPVFMLLLAVRSEAQRFSTAPATVTVQDEISPAGAMIRSLVVPGWGQYYIDSGNWNRGRLHLGADIALIGSYLGFTLNANRLDQNLVAFARQHAGTDIGQFGRDFRLQIGEFNTMREYNDFQERSRNWDRLYSDADGRFWEWDSEQRRIEYVNLNNRIDRNRQQLPAIASLMVVNRLIAGIHAFTTARDLTEGAATLSFTIPEHTGGQGLQANILISF